MNIDIKIISRSTGIFTDQTFCISLFFKNSNLITFTKEILKSFYFINSLLDNCSFIPELSTDINIGSSCTHGKTYNQSSFNELVRIVTKNLSIFASTRLGLISVNDKVRRSVLVRKYQNKGAFSMKFPWIVPIIKIFLELFAIWHFLKF